MASNIDEMTVAVDLTPFEAEHWIEHGIEPIDLEQIGDKDFLNQHEKIDKLSAQAHYQAEDKTDEFIVDLINTHEKIPVLIHNLVTIETWKEFVLFNGDKTKTGTSSSASSTSSSSSSSKKKSANEDCSFFKEHIAGLSSLRSYVPVYAEASLISLLEMCLYHSQSCDTAGDSLVDLVDYVYRKLTYLVQVPNKDLYSWPPSSAKEAMAKSEVECLDEQYKDIEFQICMSALNVCRYLTDHRQHLPITLTTRLLDNHDVLLTLVPLMEKAPWVRKRRGEFEKFDKNEWKVIHEDDLCTLPKLSSQLWLTIYNLVMDPQCRQRYDMRSHRKDNLLKLRRFLNEIVFDQIPPLVELLRTLEELSITGHYTQMTQPTLPGQQRDNTDQISSAFFVELVAEIREALLQTYKGQWKQIATQQMETIFTKETKEEMQRLQDMIAIPRLEEDPENEHLLKNEQFGDDKKSMDEWIKEVAKERGIDMDDVENAKVGDGSDSTAKGVQMSTSKSEEDTTGTSCNTRAAPPVVKEKEKLVKQASVVGGTGGGGGKASSHEKIPLSSYEDVNAMD
ncbi:unnamed protein product [Amoebophrya sp. A120]|nr:unnamed protein product [Amoebophrya sp. A120]|eukprot:GSA120T00015955001.1